MPALEDRLADMAAHPPFDPTPVTEIRGRARRRARRRRVAVVSAAVVVVASLGVGAVVVASSVADDGGEVVASGGDGSSSTVESSSPPVVAPSDPAITLDPASGFVDGTQVTVTLDPPAPGSTPIVLAQCAAVAAEVPADETFGHCVGFVGIDPDGAADPQTYRLARTIDTGEGEIDCAESGGRCVLLARVGDPIGEPETAEDRFAPLVFLSDAGGTEPAVVVDGDEGTIGDGDTLLITLTGVATDDFVGIHQCRTDVAAHLADPTGAQCDYIRSRAVDVQDGPETQLTLTAFHDVYVNDAPAPGGVAPRWAPCEPCELQVWVGDHAGPLARLPLVMEPTDAPIRPTIALDPPTGHAVGGTVGVRATGLQPGTVVSVGWCLLETAQGGGGSPCSGPAGVMLPGAYDVDDEGALTIEDLALPHPDQEGAEECLAVPGTCGVGIDSGNGSTTVAIAPLDLSG